MEVMQLCSVLQASLSPDPNERKAAEAALQQVDASRSPTQCECG